MSLRKVVFVSLPALTLACVSIYLLGSRTADVRRVDTEVVIHRAIAHVVTGPGRLRARRSVQVSAETSGKVVRLEVREGAVVARRQLLIELDPTMARERVNELRASIQLAESRLQLAEAEGRQAEADHRRQVLLHREALTTEEDLQRAATALEVKNLEAAMATQDLQRLQATFRGAEHELEKVEIRSSIHGIVTRVNIEEGENAFVGTFNNPATVLLEIADLGTIEAVIEIDESDIMGIERGQPAMVHLDAYPDRSFEGRVVAVGHSPRIDAGAELRTARFEVVVEIEGEIPGVRPGLTCEVEVRTATRRDALAIPIASLVRRNAEGPGGDGSESSGVLTIRDGLVRFHPIIVGISDDRSFEVLEGLEAGEEIVVGPFEALRALRDGDPVAIERAGDRKEVMPSS
jgi:HlyD family secretion protein